MEETGRGDTTYESKRRLMRVLLAVILVVILITSAVVVVIGAGIHWVERDVPRYSIDCCPSIVTDNEGRTHMAYIASGLCYGILGNGEWVTTSVASSMDYYSPQWASISMAVDDDGTCHIASIFTSRNGPSMLLYSTNTFGSTWGTRTLDTGSLGGFVDIATDAESGTHVAYAKDDHLMYAVFSGVDWETHSLHSDYTANISDYSIYTYMPEIVTNSSGEPSMVFLADGYVICRMTDLTGNVEEAPLWSLASYGRTTVESERLSVWFDSDDVLHTVWIERSSTYNGSSQLVHHSVDNDGGCGYENSSIGPELSTDLYDVWHEVLIDADGRMHIVLNTLLTLQHWYRSGDSWVAETIADRSTDWFQFQTWGTGVSAAYDDEGHMLVSKPFRSAGYFYDNPSLTDRLLAGFVPVAISTLIVSVLVVMCAIVRRDARIELSWHKVLSDASDPK